MRVAIVGGRSFRAYHHLEEVMDALHKKYNFTVVVCGEAAGADSLGKQWAINKGIKVESHKPNWDKFGRGAGHIRNCEMLNVSDGVVAFWNLFSPGTSHMINIAHKNNKLIHLEEYND